MHDEDDGNHRSAAKQDDDGDDLLFCDCDRGIIIIIVINRLRVPFVVNQPAGEGSPSSHDDFFMRSGGSGN
jgi:hypothetical protein